MLWKLEMSHKIKKKKKKGGFRSGFYTVISISFPSYPFCNEL